MIVFAEEALADLERIFEFNFARDPTTALEHIRRIREGISILANHPEIGRVVAGSSQRELVISYAASGYIALYQHAPLEGMVRISAVRHQREAGYLAGQLGLTVLGEGQVLLSARSSRKKAAADEMGDPVLLGFLGFLEAQMKARPVKSPLWPLMIHAATKLILERACSRRCTRSLPSAYRQTRITRSSAWARRWSVNQFFAGITRASSMHTPSPCGRTSTGLMSMASRYPEYAAPIRDSRASSPARLSMSLGALPR